MSEATYKGEHYDKTLHALQIELVKLQRHLIAKDERVLVIFGGRDAAGKDGTIKRLTAHMAPRETIVFAPSKPNERERSAWYFQRYAPHIPGDGEFVIFNRSWYNRAGVERVMEFASEDQVEQFFRDVPDFERMLVRSGIVVLKYWFSITDQEQQMRFMMRIHDPMRQWKLSPMDLQSRIRWEDYTKAKEDMLARTNIPEAPWYIVEGNDKKRERLNCIEHLLSMLSYHEQPREEVTLPERVFNADYERRFLGDELYVPKVY